MKWLLFAVCSCGGNAWTDADTKSATDAVHVQIMIETICGEAGPCTASQVRALERASLCANESMRERHKLPPIPTKGIACQP